MKSILLISFLFCLYQPKSVLACICSSLTTALANEMISDADVALEGEYIKTIHFEENIEKLWNEGDWGRNILFKVNKIYKGKVRSDTIAIYQSGSSCSRSFQKGEKYIILANEIKFFKSIKLRHSKKDKDFLGIPPPPEKLTKNGVLKDYNVPKISIDYWKNIINNYTTVTVSLCDSFIKNTEYGDLIEEEIAKKL